MLAHKLRQQWNTVLEIFLFVASVVKQSIHILSIIKLTSQPVTEPV